ncbi:Uncharacterized protein Fot_36972 [Forsythia ovata]|uniref:Uncharacterized protein n=1 Tax=Forsythia ovata TaxID=205694 RepID=A0ABD1STH9_9LAMI
MAAKGGGTDQLFEDIKNRVFLVEEEEERFVKSSKALFLRGSNERNKNTRFKMIKNDDGLVNHFEQSASRSRPVQRTSFPSQQSAPLSATLSAACSRIQSLAYIIESLKIKNDKISHSDPTYMSSPE